MFNNETTVNPSLSEYVNKLSKYLSKVGHDKKTVNLIYSRTSMAQTPLEPWKYV